MSLRLAGWICDGCGKADQCSNTLSGQIVLWVSGPTYANTKTRELSCYQHFCPECVAKIPRQKKGKASS